MALLDEMLAWSQRDLKPWQQDALRRLFQQHELTEGDFAELSEMLLVSKGFRGPDAVGPTAVPLAPEHLPVMGGGAPPISLVALHSVKHVNRLATEQTLQFHPGGLTVVYGDNGAGKSGYARVLKSACRARVKGEPILGDARQNPVLHKTPEAKVTVQVEGSLLEAGWTAAGPAPDLLSSVAVLDTQCVRAYADQEGELIFSPWGLDMVQNLARSVFPAVQALIEGEQKKLALSDAAFSDLKLANTPTAVFLKSLSHKTTDDAVNAATNFTPDDEARLNTVNASLAEKTPAQKAKACREQAQRLRTVVRTMQAQVALVSDEVVGEHKAAVERLLAGEAAETLAADQMRAESELLPGTGQDTWRALFKSAQAFMASEHLDHDEGQPCPLCQTALSVEAAQRMKRFAEFVAKDASERAATERAAKASRLATLAAQGMDWQLDEATFAALATVDDAWPGLVEKLKAELKARQQWLLAVVPDKQAWATVPLVTANPFELPEALALSSEREAAALDAAQNPQARADLQLEAANLAARKALAARCDALIEHVAALRLKQCLDACMAELKTRPISDKASAFASEAVTNQLGEALNTEFDWLGVQRLQTTLKTRIDKGKPKLKLVLDLPGATEPRQVLSEGEQRVIAIASFFAELAVSGHTGAAVFDDPVSSLDHLRRQRVARRLVEEAKTRQVIVFTHDSVFLAELLDAIQNTKLPSLVQHLTYTPADAGIVNEGLPWHHASYKSRLDALEKLAREFARGEERMDNVQAERASREIYGKLRQVIERVVEDVVLCGVLKRYNDYVRVPKIKDVVGLTAEDCNPLIGLYQTAGDILDGHDKASARQFAAPTAAETQRHITALGAAITALQDRRKAAKAAA
jgi:energy-coupling factor transporter ATP-binding protein EcfA2